MESLTQRYADQILGVLSCYDRVVITGTLPEICYVGAMTGYLHAHGIEIADYTRFADSLRQEIRDHAERLARESGLTIEFIQRNNFRKEDRIREILRERGEAPGLVHIFSAMEPCSCFKPRIERNTRKGALRGTEGRCLHYYFYFLSEELGLCYLRVPTWAPFRLQFYFNAHNQLALELKRAGIGFQLVDNTFTAVEDFAEAQRLADSIRVDTLHRLLDRCARWLCPVLSHFQDGYHWSLMQVEYATDVIFQRREDLEPLYEVLVRTAIHAVKPEQVAQFLGRKLDEGYTGEIGNDFHTRIEGTRIKHHMGRVSIKMYDKLGRVLRIETTANDVTFFKHYRRVEHRNGASTMKTAPVKKSIYSLLVLAQLMGAANRRYLEFLSDLDDPTQGIKDLEKISRRTKDGKGTSRGFNLFLKEDRSLFEALVRGEFNIHGLHAKDLRRLLPDRTKSQISRLLKRLRTHGLLKKVGRTYKYYLTRWGKRVIVAALQCRRLFLIPALAEGSQA
jgi:hypothetical protein